MQVGSDITPLRAFFDGGLRVICILRIPYGEIARPSYFNLCVRHGVRGPNVAMAA